MGWFTRMWVQWDNPRLAEAIRYAQRVLQLDKPSSRGDALMVQGLALDAHTRLRALLDEMMAGYQSAGRCRRHLTAMIDRDTTPIMDRLATVAHMGDEA